MPEPALTARQARFIDEYLVDANATQAAIRAGSAPAGAHVWASRTLRNPKVSAVLQTRLAADSERLRVSRGRVIAMLLSSFELAKERGEPAAMVSACRELGRMLGYYEPLKAQIDVFPGGDLQKRLQAMSDQELLALIGDVPSQPPPASGWGQAQRPAQRQAHA